MYYVTVNYIRYATWLNTLEEAEKRFNELSEQHPYDIVDLRNDAEMLPVKSAFPKR